MTTEIWCRCTVFPLFALIDCDWRIKMKKIICFITATAFILSALVAFADEENNNIDNLQNVLNSADSIEAITGFGDVDVRYSDNISEIEEKEFLTNWSRGTDYIDQSKAAAKSVEENGWHSCGTMTSARSYMSSTAIDGNIYTFGGTENNVVTNKVEVFNTETETWASLRSMPTGRYKHKALSFNNKIYICGGYNSQDIAASDILVYDVLSNSWIDNISVPNQRTNYSAGVYDGELFIFGGKENGQGVKNTYKYNFETQSWTPLASLPIYTEDAETVEINRGFYLISNFSIYEYDVLENTWFYVDKMAREVYDCAFVNRGDDATNELYITGGRNTSVGGVSVANTKYRFDTDSIADVPNWKAEWYNDLRMIRGLACHNMVISEDTIYVFGGQVTYGEDQKLMFKRSIHDTKDDNPVSVRNEWNDYIYGSINSVDDTDKYQFTPTTSGYYDITHFNPIQSNNLKYEFNITVQERGGKVLVNGMYTNSFGAVYMQAGKVYDIDIFDIEEIHRGNYMYRIRKVDDDAPDEISEAVEIPIEQDISKSFAGKDDVDYMQFTIPVSGEYNISVETQEPVDDGLNTIADILIWTGSKKEVYSFDTYFDSIFKYRLNAGTYYISLKPLNFYYNKRTPGYTLNIHNVSKEKVLYNNRARHNMDNINGKIYVFGGLDDNFDLLPNIEVYNPDTRLWSIESVNTSTIKKDAMFLTADNKLYVLGGYSSGTYYSDIKSYDTEKQVWRNEGSLTTARGRATTVTDGRYIYVIGGRNANGYLNTVEVFDTATAKISKTFELPEALVEPQAFLYNDSLYVVGGVGYEGYSKRVYMRENDSWTEKSPMPYASEYVRGKLYNNDFICAAVNDDGNIDLLKYTPSSNSWERLLTNYINDLIYYGFDIFNDHLYITGGYSYNSRSVTGRTYSYDLSTDVRKQDKNAPVRMMGFEYEQTNDDVAETPEILNVNARIIDKFKGIYELYLKDEDYKCDPRSIPVFFWTAREGMFAGASEDYRSVIFYADPGTGDRNVKVTVGIGDGRGYADKKAFFLNGNSEQE